MRLSLPLMAAKRILMMAMMMNWIKAASTRL